MKRDLLVQSLLYTFVLANSKNPMQTLESDYEARSPKT